MLTGQSPADHGTPTGLSAFGLNAPPAAAPCGESFEELRAQAAAALRNLRPPSAKDELWRQTPPDRFPFARLAESSPIEFALKTFEGSAFTSAALKLSALESASGILARIFQDWSKDLSEDPVALLQILSTSAVTYLKIPAETKVTAPLVLSQILPSSGAAAALVVVEVERGAQIVLVEDLVCDQETFLAPRVEVVLQENSSCEFISIQRLSGKATYLGKHRFNLLRDAQLKTMHAFIGSKTSRLDLACFLREPGASAELNSIYVATGSRHVDFHPVQEHLAPYCTSNLYAKGALSDESRGVYCGLIRVAEAAQKTNAYQKSRNLVLSPDARADAIPNLEIRANDVKCSHGATVGQVSRDEMFYLMTRGIDEAQAQQLLVEGFFEDVLSRLPHENLHQHLYDLVMGALRGWK